MALKPGRSPMQAGSNTAMSVAESGNHKLNQNVMRFTTLLNNSILLSFNVNFADGSVVLPVK